LRPKKLTVSCAFQTQGPATNFEIVPAQTFKQESVCARSTFHLILRALRDLCG
jgi:hypothetical protein